MTHEESKELVKQLASALEDLNAVRRDVRETSCVRPSARGPFESLLERAAVQIEGVRIALRMS